ncbi:type II toxin-antitoxin system RelE/ParE family toxin [Stenotrophomonas sp. SKA14]|nr:type II toxin-antitoxin system RelE/ParE family toxin [Stenotrophomonas sp. SKA14]
MRGGCGACFTSWTKPSVLETWGLPGNRLHPLRGSYSGYWAVSVSASWRLVFRFRGLDVELVDYLDYH